MTTPRLARDDRIRERGPGPRARPHDTPGECARASALGPLADDASLERDAGRDGRSRADARGFAARREPRHVRPQVIRRRADVEERRAVTDRPQGATGAQRGDPRVGHEAPSLRQRASKPRAQHRHPDVVSALRLGAEPLGAEADDPPVGGEPHGSLAARERAHDEARVRAVARVGGDEGSEVRLGEDVRVPHDHVPRAELHAGVRHAARRTEEVGLLRNVGAAPLGRTLARRPRGGGR